MKDDTWGALFTEAARIAGTLDHVKKKSNEKDSTGTIIACDTLEALDIAKQKVKVYHQAKFTEVLEFMLGGVAPNVWNDRGLTTKEMVVALYEKAAIVYKDV